MLGGNLLPLPVHAGRLAVVDLHAVHAHVALARFRVARNNAGQSDEAASVQRPALQDRKVEQVEVLREDDFLAGASFAAIVLGKNCRLRPAWAASSTFQKALRRLHLHEGADAAGNFIQRIDLKGKLHAPLAAELVHQDAATGIAFDILEEQRRAAGRSSSLCRISKRGR